VRHFGDVDRDRAARAIEAARRRAGEGPAWLRPDEVRETLLAYRIPVPESVLARTADEAAAAARRLGFPVVVKLASDRITHKSDVGGVVLDVRSEDETREAFDRISRRIEAAGRRADMDGVTVQPLVREGVEAIVGVTQDPSFGPLLMFGLGGVHVELLRDVAFRIQPLTERDAHDMVRAVRGYPLLEGYRGAAPGDVAALEQTLMRVSQLAEDHPDLVEMDLNPIKVLRPGQGCTVVDARIAVRA
jgi:acyl-CoA synthetase (NDP forming)